MPQFQRKDQRNSTNYPKTTFNPKTHDFFMEFLNAFIGETSYRIYA